MNAEHLLELIQDRGLISGRDKKFFLRSLSRPDLGPTYKVLGVQVAMA
jgi:hypothetical protein